ncbi:hypothetical protein [Saccharothrix australiensis]|uniref:Uncharacterized protein n=1 Tax=Saccharothrix australiensis TaxID=2072 RepID=A0A495W0B4_9PSEU|nr:hypothetical protein [Saccharothrix australiensis]RKT55131.1 hypothetical protein C8E97_3787 [Saccharothrix australiensis]
MDPRTASRSAELVAEAANALTSAAPAGWSELALSVTATALAYEFAVSVRDDRGADPGQVVLSPVVTDAFQELRGVLYEEDRGTWFSARMVLRPGAEPEVSFNFDEDPRWWPALHPTTFVRDLEVFPRSEEHIPPWLRALLDAGEAAEREREAAEPQR